MTAARSIIAVLLCSAAVVCVVEGCGFHYPAVVGREQEGDAPEGDAPAPYTDEQVAAHFNNQGVLRGGDALKTMFSCVDARGSDPMLGTPGGTFSEFAMGLQVWEQLRGEVLDYAGVSKMFRAFMSSRYISPSNRFYFHNADNNLGNLFKYLQEKGITANILPDVEPKEGADHWYDGLVLPDANGCGHVRLQLAGQRDNNGDLVYGKRAEDINRYLIKAFYKYWWPTPRDSPERRRIFNEILPGDLEGRSVTIIGAENPAPYSGRRLLQNTSSDVAAIPAEVASSESITTPAGSRINPQAAKALAGGASRRPVDRSNRCSTIWPLVTPNRGGSSVFCYHAAAVAQYRESIITVWFDQQDNAKGNKFTRKHFNEALAELAGKQLGATLSFLAPANAVGITKATYKRTK